MTLRNGFKNVLRYLYGTVANVPHVLAGRRERVLAASEWSAVQFSFSQLGEDRLILFLLQHLSQKKGVYVDVGAFHPVTYSNTLLLYRRGWRGVNIDANAEAIRLFARYRPDDKNICAAVSNKVVPIDYLVYPCGASNRITVQGTENRASLIAEAPVRTVPMTTRRLEDILQECVPAAELIDFLNIDCEGEDINVLDSLDWERRRPSIIAVEGQDEQDRQVLTEYLSRLHYKMVAQVFVTLVFVSKAAADRLKLTGP